MFALNSSMHITSVKGLRLILIELENNEIEVVIEIPNFLDIDLNDCFSSLSCNIFILSEDDIFDPFLTILKARVNTFFQSLHINFFV